VFLLAFVGFQTLPLPTSLAQALSRPSGDAQLARVEVFRQAGLQEFLPSDAKDGARVASVSASAAATQRSFYLITAYVGAFLVLANTLVSWRQVQAASSAIAVSGFVMVVFALAQKLSGTSDIYWFHQPRFGGDIFGPFTNRNHFAAYINMTLGVTLGLLLPLTQRSSFRALSTWREKLVWLSTAKGSRMTLLGFATALMAAAVCVSLSRGAMTSLVAALGMVGGIAALRNRSLVHRRSRMAAALGLLTVASVLYLGGQPVLDRLGTLAQVARDPLGNARTAATLDTLDMFAAAPALGNGFGTFRHVFPAFQRPSLQFGRWPHAHNDYAQLLAEGGVVGALIVLIAACLFATYAWQRLRKAAPEARWMAAGLAVGILTVAVHSLFDFSLHKPANALLLAALCGICMAAVSLPERPGVVTIRGPGDEPRRKRRKHAFGSCERP
jgi:O-antigen ligase